MPRRYKLGADGQAHPAYFGKLPEEFTKEDTLRFLADTDIQLYRLLSADTHAALRAEGYEYKNGGPYPHFRKGDSYAGTDRRRTRRYTGTHEAGREREAH